jgi:hypothetical protein
LRELFGDEVLGIEIAFHSSEIGDIESLAHRGCNEVDLGNPRQDVLYRGLTGERVGGVNEDERQSMASR